MTRDMHDNLEKFVKNNRSEFDSKEAKDAIWKNIHTALDASEKSNSKIIFWRAAAVILFIFSVGITFYANNNSIISNRSDVVYDSEFLNTEKYYSSVINERQKLIVFAAKAYPEIESDFELDWKLLDDSYTQLKEDYANNQSSEISDALVQNLRARVDLLSRQIEILESIERDEKKFLEI